MFFKYYHYVLFLNFQKRTFVVGTLFFNYYGLPSVKVK